jgi:hypothetical protein
MHVRDSCSAENEKVILTAFGEATIGLLTNRAGLQSQFSRKRLLNVFLTAHTRSIRPGLSFGIKENESGIK